MGLIWSLLISTSVTAGADGTLLERSVMKEDEKWGWVYSGESKKDEWLWAVAVPQGSTRLWVGEPSVTTWP